MRRIFHILILAMTWMSLTLAIVTVLLWIDGGLGFLRPRLWLGNPEGRLVSIGGGVNMLAIEDYRKTSPAIIGPDSRDGPAVKAFSKQFDQPSSFEITLLRTKTLSRPIYSTDGQGHVTMMGTSMSILVPFGLLIPLFLPLPARHWLPPLIRRLRARFIIPAGCCKNCGYDLRGTPDRCPECGTIPSSASPKVAV